MKSRFFFGVFVGFFLGCLFFFGVMNVNAQTRLNDYGTEYYEAYYNPAANSNLYAYLNAYNRNADYNWNNYQRYDYNYYKG